DFAEGAGALLLTEEVLAASDSNCLVEAIRQQPAWSDVPILLLCDSGADSPVAIWSMELLGNVTVLERPVRLTTLVSALRTALKARRRKYELRNQVEAVRSSEGRLRVTLNSIGDAVITTDIQGRVTSLNPVAESLTGWPQAEAQGQPLEAVFRIINEQS